MSAPLPKAWWRSRTLWFNLLAGLLLLAESNLHLLQPLLPVNLYQLAAFVLPMVNLGLRVVTRGPVGRCDGQAAP